MTADWPAAVARGRWVDSLLAVAAVLAVTWPIGGLLSTRPWTVPLVALLLLLVVVGSLVRTARVPAWLVLLAQLLALASGLAVWAQGQRPGESAVTALSTLAVQGVDTIQHYAVPAPATPGLVLLVLAGTGLLALLVEAVGVTFRAAAVAGVPLLLVSAATASSTGTALDPRYFLLAAAAWLLLLTQQGRTTLVRSQARSTVTTVDSGAVTRGGLRRLSVTARVMGLSALLLAVVLPGALPHLPPTVLLDRAGDPQSGSVSFTDTLDLAQDLADRSTAPVLRYRTDDPAPPPLRVSATTHYADGRWYPAESLAGPEDTEIRTLTQLFLASHDVEVSTQPVTVTQNGMRAPQLAVPYPTSTVDVGEVPWTWDPVSEVVGVESAPRTYEASYLKLGPLTTLPESVGAPPQRLLDVVPVAEVQEDGGGWEMHLSRDGQPVEFVQPDGTRQRPFTDGSVELVAPDGTAVRTFWGVDTAEDPLHVDPRSADRVRALATEITAGLTNQVEIALEIQRYLRGPDFTYSLTLADPVAGPDGEALDPLSHFLETKQGYCTQFASAMVMLARATGIPARLAVGFLPGSEGLDGTRTVVASDAHAWPELYVSGLGWTRFEPTPSSRAGSAPFYATPGNEEEVPTVGAEPTAGRPTPSAAAVDALDPRGGGTSLGWWDRNGRTLGQVALGLAALAALLSVVPLAGAWRRWRLRHGPDVAQRIEGEWAVLVTGLADLGVPPPDEAATPRGLRDHYARELAADPPTLDALTRAAGRLEAARYAARPPSLGTMGEDVRRVLDQRRRHAPRGRRLRAALLPGDGTAQLRSLLPGARPAPAPSAR